MSTRIVRGGIAGLASTIAAVLVPGVAAADTNPPAPPAGLRVQSLSFTSVTLAWSPSADDSGWVMYEAEANALPRSVLRYASTEPTKTISGLIPGLTYNASVVAVDGSRNRSAPVSIRFTTPVDTTAPTTPTLRAVMVGGTVNSIAWNAASDNSRVRYILRSSGNAIYATWNTSVTAWELLHLDCVVLPGSTHTLTVEAQDDHNNVSGRSRPVTVTFPTR